MQGFLDSITYNNIDDFKYLYTIETRDFSFEITSWKGLQNFVFIYHECIYCAYIISTNVKTFNCIQNGGGMDSGDNELAEMLNWLL